MLTSKPEIVPMVRVDLVAQGHSGLEIALSTALGLLGNVPVARFLDKVGVRGQNLWNLFTEWRTASGNKDAGLTDYVKFINEQS